MDYSRKLRTLKLKVSRLKKALPRQKREANRQIARSRSVVKLVKASKLMRGPAFNASLEFQREKERLVYKTLHCKLVNCQFDPAESYQLMEKHHDFLATTLGHHKNQLQQEFLLMYKRHFASQQQLTGSTEAPLKVLKPITKPPWPDLSKHYRKPCPV